LSDGIGWWTGRIDPPPLAHGVRAGARARRLRLRQTGPFPACPWRAHACGVPARRWPCMPACCRAPAERGRQSRRGHIGQQRLSPRLQQQQPAHACGLSTRPPGRRVSPSLDGSTGSFRCGGEWSLVCARGGGRDSDAVPAWTTNNGRIGATRTEAGSAVLCPWAARLCTASAHACTLRSAVRYWDRAFVGARPGQRRAERVRLLVVVVPALLAWILMRGLGLGGSKLRDEFIVRRISTAR
jgi:hypothetical protein